MDIILLLFGILLGFSVAYIISGKKEGEQGLIKSLIFSIKNYHLHFHHWLSGLIILLILVSIGFYHDLIYGLLFGTIAQGLTYRDFYRLVYKK